MIGADVYAAFRGTLDSGRHPGNAKVMALQTIPAMTGLTTLGLAGLARAIGGGDTDRDEGKDDLRLWLLALGSGALLLTAVGIPVALALSGRSVGSWFLRDTTGLPMLGAVEHAGADPTRPTATARVFEPTTLWPAAAPGGGDRPAGLPRRHPARWRASGTRARASSSMRYGGDTVTFRLAGTDTDVRLTDPETATGVVALLQGSVAGVRAEVVGTDEPPNALPLPAPGLADPGDAGPLEVAPTLRTTFVRVPTRRANAIVLREAPRSRYSTPAGNDAGAATPFPLLPQDASRHGGRAAAPRPTSGALLVTAASPTAGPVSVADARPGAARACRR